MKKENVRKIFLIYIAVLSVMLLFKFHLSPNYIKDKIDSIKWNRELGNWNINLIPFRTITSQWESIGQIPIVMMKNLAGNMIPFIPFGILLPICWRKYKKKYSKTFLAGVVYILMIEMIQLICMLGYFDVDDVILNCIGVLFGIGINKMLL